MDSRTRDSSHILRLAAWIWIGYLLAVAFMDFLLYAKPGLPLLPANLDRLPLLPGPLPVNRINSLFPVVLYYATNGLVALCFLALAYWQAIKSRLGRSFYPLAVLAISVTPVVINVLIVPRFPAGPLANAEGMALRQLPVLFLALALVAGEYPLRYIIFFSIAITGLELGLITLVSIQDRSAHVLVFLAIIRTISFIALGVFINLLVTRLKENQESLRKANAKLTHYASTLEQLTISRERNRLARELHDTLAHSLTALSVSLETAKAYFEIDPLKSRNLLDQSLEATRTGVRETRRTLKALRSSALEDLGLSLAIRRLAESTGERAKLSLEFELPDSPASLSPDVEDCIYRIAQEAIENAAHHADAKTLTVSLAINSTGTTLMVMDDGRGFDHHGTSQPGHFGLVGMRERAELIGGHLSVDSKQGKGTKIMLTI